MITACLWGPQDSWSHGGEKHPDKAAKSEKSISISSESKEFSDSGFEEINSSYLRQVKPIFSRSCFNCHSSNVEYPWYYKLPLIKGVIDKDISDARMHLDFSKDFPFKSHDSSINDLKAINNAITDKSMPPFRYKVLHPGSKLSKEEIRTIKLWIKNSLGRAK